MIKKLLFPTFGLLMLIAVSVATPKSAEAWDAYACDGQDCYPLAYWSCIETLGGCDDKFCGHASDCHFTT